MLRVIEGRPLVRIAVENALAAAGRVIVVLGHEADAVRAACGSDPRVRFVTNPHYADGMLGSIQRGARAVGSEWFFIVPGDLPRIDAGLYERVASDGGGGTSPAVAVVPLYRGTRGHPVLVHRSVIPALLDEPRSAGPMRRFLDRYAITRIDLDREEITLDLDTDEDVRRLFRGR